jgi:hypothetical protein
LIRFRILYFAALESWTSDKIERMKKTLILLLLLPVLGFSQMTKKDSLWMPLKPFAGTWVGEGDGEPGKGKYERTYQQILNKNFIEIRNKSTYPSTDKNPKGEVHEDIGYFSYDRGKKKFRLRQFHAESFVNEFTLDSISADKKTIVFVTDNIENLPKGFRARETYRFINDNEFEETFEIAEPNKEFAVYTKVHFKRK